MVGISSDGEKSHAAFSAHHSLPYPLLADPGGAVRRAFGIPKMLGVIDARATFIVDREGIIREAFLSQIRAGAHVQRALERDPRARRASQDWLSQGVISHTDSSLFYLLEADVFRAQQISRDFNNCRPVAPA